MNPEQPGSEQQTFQKAAELAEQDAAKLETEISELDPSDLATPDIRAEKEDELKATREVADKYRQQSGEATEDTQQAA